MSISPNVETVSQIRELSSYNTGGTRLGQSATDLIAFFGATPTVQSASGNQATIASTAASGGYYSSNYTSLYGFTTASQANGIVARLNEIIIVLTNLGLWKGAA